MDDDSSFVYKWVFGVIGFGLFVLTGYIIAPENFTVVLGILVGAGFLGILMNQWGKKDAYN
jgi:hypothetical protein